MTRRRRITLWIVGLLAVLAVVSGWVIHQAITTAGLKERIEAYLSDELDSDVTIDTLDGRLFPRVSVSGAGITVRKRGQTGVPPLLTIKQFEIAGSFGDLVMKHPRHVADVKLQGLLVQIPPDDHDDSDDKDEPKKSDAQQIAEAKKYEEIIIDRFEAPNTILKLISSKPHKPPKEFIIHDLVMNSVGSNQTIPYVATLTNPIPKGEIKASGTFGPWNVVHPPRTPVTGKYTFENADLGTINGLSGTLNSVGDFKGPLNRLEVQGTTDSADFQVDKGGKAVPLHTKFTAIVDGSDGDTYLTRVDAKFLSSELVAKGKVIGLEGVHGREVDVDVTMDKGRIEDLLKLAMDSDKPIIVGPATLRASLVVPAEKGRKVIDKLKLKGEFGLTRAKFTDAGVQQKLIGLSRHGQGKDADEAMDEVLSNLKGRFVLDDAVITFERLTFGVPGAEVALAGRYGLRSEEIDFKGDLRLEATLSQAAGGGVKGFFLKAFDPFFKEPGAGTVLPIKIQGSRKAPKFGLNLFDKSKNGKEEGTTKKE